MAGFGTIAPGLDDDAARELLARYPVSDTPASFPPVPSASASENEQPDWREREAEAGLAASRPSGVSTMWQAIKHPSLYPMYKAMTAPREEPAPEASANLPDAGPPLIPSGPQISAGTRIGSALSQNLPEAVFGSLKSGVTAPGEALSGKLPMYTPEGTLNPDVVGRALDIAALAGGGSVAGTAERAAARAPGDFRVMGRQLFSDTGKPAAAAAVAAHAPQYTTSIEGALDRIPSQVLTGDQFANQLKRYGAKPEEMAHRDVNDLLVGQPLVTKAQIRQHLADNPVELRPIERAVKPWEELTSEQQYKIADMHMENRPHIEEDNPRDYYNRLVEENATLFGDAPVYQQYTVPGGENYRERLMQLPMTGKGDATGAADFAKQMREKYGDRWVGELTPAENARYDALIEASPKESEVFKGGHWEEPNVLFHRRSTDRNFEEPLTQDQIYNNQARDFAINESNSIQDQMGEIGRQINRTRMPIEAARREQIFSDMRAGKITPPEAQRRFDEVPDIPELKPLQDKLQELRAYQDRVHREIPDKVEPQKTLSLHDEENQSDWHQQGREKGYGSAVPPDWQVRKYPENPDYWQIYSGNRTIADVPVGVASNEREALSMAARQKGLTDIPDAPFKGTGWERLALHDQLREAAEKGYPRISWTAGEENPTNPMVMMRGRSLDELPAARQAEILRADKGIKDYYNRRRVDQANKIGKAHGVQVQRGALPNQIPAYYMDIPDSLRKELLSKPMSLFSDTGEAAKAAAVAEHLPAEQTGAQNARYADWHAALEGRENVPAQDVHPTATGEGAGAAPAAPAPGDNVPGGAGGRDAGLEQAQISAERAAGRHLPLPGLPQKALPVGDRLYIPGPIGKIKDVAESYMRDRPQPTYHLSPDQYHPVDPEHSKAIAQAFEDMPHAPDDPAVKNSYAAMIKETRDQYDHIRAQHPELQIEANKPGEDPYAATPRLAARDVAENNHFSFFPTQEGFGTGEQGGIDMATHPMMQPSGRTLNGKPLLNNDLFRIVHDYFGHLKEGYGFRAAGEDNAWRSHAAMYSDLARPAMTSETRGQNSWVNYGPHAEANRGASAADTIYTDQKVGLMPEWTMRDRGSPEPIITYQGSPSGHSMVDMSKIGSGEGSAARGQGMYSAEAEPIGKAYRIMTAVRQDPLLKKYRLNERDTNSMARDLADTEGDHGPVVEDLRDHIENMKARLGDGTLSDVQAAETRSQIDRSQRMIRYLNDSNRAKGHLYQLALDRPMEHFLHWDKPFSEQSDYVKQKLQPMLDERTPVIQQARAHLLARTQERLAQLPPGVKNQRLEADLQRYSQPVDWTNTPGEKLYGVAAHSALGRAAKDAEEAYPVASQYLRARGIAGIRYLAGQNFNLPRGVLAGSHNYVSFTAPRILKRYAIPGAIGAGAAGAAASQRGENGS
jgi:hypothetical protein